MSGEQERLTPVLRASCRVQAKHTDMSQVASQEVTLQGNGSELNF